MNTKDGFLQKTEKVFSREEQDKIVEACLLCEKVHFGQIRRTGEDFFTHPIAVAETLLKWNTSLPMIIAAILHDSVEDTTLTLSEIEQKFGYEVMLYVFGLTKDFFGGDSPEEMTQLLLEAPNILIIKLADRLHNLESMSALSLQKRKEKSLETLSVYVPIACHLQMYSVAEELKQQATLYI